MLKISAFIAIVRKICGPSDENPRDPSSSRPTNCRRQSGRCLARNVRFAARALDATVPDRANFRAAIGVLPLGQISIIGCDVGAIDLFRSKQLVQDGNDDISLVICMTGIANLRFDGDFSPSGLAKPRSCPIIASEGSRATATSHLCSLRIPRALLRNMFGGTELPCLRPISSHDGRLRLLSTYARAPMAENSLRPATVKLADRHLVELVAHLWIRPPISARRSCSAASRRPD